MPAWDSLPPAERYAQMARQGHGFLTSLPVRVVKPEEAERGVLIDVARDGKEIGEIVFFGNICAKGYYKDPEATKKLFAGGALHSGDLAVMHPDGSAQIQDRAKDIIISGELPTYLIFPVIHSYSVDDHSTKQTNKQTNKHLLTKPVLFFPTINRRRKH